MQLKDKVVLITGSSSGIGAAIAVAFAKEGAKVVINYSNNIDGAKKVSSELEVIGAENLIVKADISKSEEVDEMFTKIVERFGSIDILINNAGVPTDRADFLNSTKEDFLWILETNLIGPMLCSQRAIKIMQEKGSGKIINTSSVRGAEHAGRAIAYSAGKAALNSFTKSLAKQVAPQIQVNAIAPGFVHTRNYDKITEEMKQKFVADTYLKRWIHEEEIAEAFVFVAKNDALTGQVIYVDGGYTLK